MAGEAGVRAVGSARWGPPPWRRGRAQARAGGRSTVTEAIREIRPLLADRGFAVPDRPGLRLRTLADVFACAAAEGVTLRIDGTETQARRPKAHRPGRCVFASGKKKQSRTPARPPRSATARARLRAALQ
ncbi:hypothetical protein [Streptomyces sp. T12]|uniref:hypothetical protein n=1 Tax=Streptomyces sp. T12 TaxID=477697 RepID=UPI0035A28541